MKTYDVPVALKQRLTVVDEAAAIVKKANQLVGRRNELVAQLRQADKDLTTLLDTSPANAPVKKKRKIKQRKAIIGKIPLDQRMPILFAKDGNNWMTSVEASKMAARAGWRSGAKQPELVIHTCLGRHDDFKRRGGGRANPTQWLLRAASYNRIKKEIKEAANTE
tara:strand:- start:3336 stop:3830 length:495 start_codon:yes stop_codon:yes gene_type:complete